MNHFESAKSYAERGWNVLPVHGVKLDGNCTCGNIYCAHAGKHPRTAHGYKDATLDLEEICRFCQFESTNIGIATGAVSKICVVDIDANKGGVESINELQSKYGLLPRTVTVLTGHTNSEHLYFNYPAAGIGCKVDLLPGIDIRGDGGFVVAPPSLHKTGKRYAFEASSDPDETELADLPDWFLNLVNSKSSNTKTEANKGGVWSEGCRNENLFRLASSFRSRGLSTEQIETLLLSENQVRCHPKLHNSEVKKIAQSAGKYEPNSKNHDIKWSAVQALPSTEVEVQSLQPELIPKALQPWIFDVVERMQSSSEMLMAPLLVILGGLIGRRLGVRPKQKDNWTVIPNLWGGLVAPPSAMKSPIMKAALSFIYKLDATARAVFDEEMREYNKKIAEQKAKKKENKNNEEPDDEHIEKPVRKRYLVNEATTEKLGELLTENLYGLTLFRDELLGFFMTLDKPGRESDRQFYLESFNGDTPFTYDRILRGTVEIPALCMSILGGIQPDLLSDYFEDAVKNGSSSDGFFARFQVMVYPPKKLEFKLVDRYPDREAFERVFAIFRRIDEMDFIGHGFEKGSDDPIPFARFDGPAQEVFYHWLTTLEVRLRSGEIESPAFEAHLTKYKKLMPSLALIFHVIDICDPKQQGSFTTKISLSATTMAAAWCDFLEEHAKKIYADSERVVMTVARVLSKRILAGDITDRMTVRNLYRKEWSMLRNPKTIRSALVKLEALGWLRVIEESPTGKGAPSEVILLNPSLIGRRHD